MYYKIIFRTEKGYMNEVIINGDIDKVVSLYKENYKGIILSITLQEGLQIIN